MFNKFVKKSSKFFAVLLTATLAFTPLSYAAAPTTFYDLGVAISDGTTSIGLESNIVAEATDTTLGTQGAAELTIKGDNFSVSGAGTASGFEIGEGQSATVVDTTFEKFVKDGDGAVISNKGSLTVENSTFTLNSASQYGGAIYNAGKMVVNNSSFTANTVTGGEAPVANDVYNEGDLFFLSGITTMEGGILGTGKATVDEGAQLILSDNATLQQKSLVIGTDSQLNVAAEGMTIEDAITNNGTLEIFGTGSNTNAIEGEGTLVISGAVSNTASIKQSTITVASGVTFKNGEDSTITTNALLGEGELQNNGKLFLNLDSSEGFGIKEITSDASSGSQQGETTITTNTTGIEIDLTGRTLKQGVVNFEGTGTLSLTADPEGEDYTLYTNIVNYLQTEDGTDGLNLHIDVYPSLDNRGVVSIYEDGSASYIINSTGTVNFLGGTKYSDGIGTDNEEDISKNILNIGDAEHATDFTLNGSAQISSQAITVSSGSLTMSSGRDGGAIIRNSSMTITADGSLIAWSADAINTVDNEIRSDGQITFEKGVNKNNIVGTGTLVIDGEVVNGNAESEEPMISISQSTVTISGVDSVLSNVGEITTNYLSGDGTLENETILRLNVKDDKAFGITSLTGVGVSSITVTADAQDETTIGIFGATIKQDRLEFYGDKTLRLDGSTNTRAVAPITTVEADIYNYMAGDSLHLTSVRLEGDFVNNTDAVAYFEENSSVSGQIINNGGTLNIVSSGFVVENGITSDEAYQTDISKNILNIGDSTKGAVVKSSTTISYQTITVSSGSLIMSNMVGNDVFDGYITNSSITVATDGLLSVNPTNLVNISNPITNNGIIEYYGGTADTAVVNVSTITGSGELQINGIVENQEGTKLTQNEITISEESAFTANASDINTTAGTGIVNDGTLTFVGAEDTENTSIISGNGILVIASSEVANSANITQKDIVIESQSEFENNGAAVVATSSMTVKENGVLENAGTVETVYLINNNEIENGDSEEGETGTITVTNTLDNNKKVTNSSGEIRANIFNNNIGSSLDNKEYGVIVSTALVNNGTIVSSGSITAYRSLDNAHIATITNSSGTISAKLIDNNGLIENGEDAKIEADIFYNEVGGTINNLGTITTTDVLSNAGTLTSNADGIKSVVFNDTTGVYNVTGGTIAYNISGAESGGSIVNISNEVTLSSQVYISQNIINLTEESTFILGNEQMLETSTLNIGNKSTLDTQNGLTAGLIVKDINIAQGITWNWKLDLDLADNSGDMLTNVNETTGILLIDDIKLLSDKGTVDPIQIADANVNAQIVDGAIFATQNNEYEITADNREDSTWLSVMVKGTGGLPRAIYDGASSYSIVSDGEVVTDMVTKWMEEPEGTPNNFLKNDLTIHGNNNILTSTTNVTGIDVKNHELTIEDLQEFSGFDNAITVDNEDGELRVKDVTFKNNTGDAVITNNGTTTLNGVTFAEFDSEDLDPQNEASIDVANNGELVLTGNATTFNKGISGEGTTTIKGIGIDMGEATLQQARVEISDVEGSSLTVKVANLSTGTVTTSLIMNNGQLSLVGGEDDAAELNSEIKGIGDTTLSNKIDVASNISQENINISEQAEITINDSASIKASTITVNADATLTANADNIITTTDGKIANAGEITFTGGTNKNVIEGETGILFISGEVANSTGTKVSQQFIEVREGGKFTMNADDVETATDDASGTNMFGIQNNGDLEITGGTNKNIIGRGDGAVEGNGNVIISGNVINEEKTTIDQGTITVNYGASLQANASDLTTDNGIANAGELVFVGSDMVNTSTITGTGNLTIKSNLTSSTTITQTNIDIVEGTFTHNAADNGDLPKITAANISISTSATLIAHSEIVANEQITNDGKFEINVLTSEGQAEEVSSANNISGKGEFKISSTVYTNDGGTISQKTITIADEDSGFTSDIQKVTTTDGIANSGELTFTGEGTNKNVISGTGNLTIAGTIENSTGTAISQNAIAITNGNGFKTRADDVTTIEGIENNGTLTFIGGVNTSTITMLSDGEGILIVENDLTNQAVSINQKEINITGGDFENVRTSSITAEAITVADGSSLITDAKDLAISDSITITGEETVLNLKDEEAAEIAAAIMGAGKIVKEGEGTVTLSGDNAYTGTTTISKGAIEIVAESGISKNTIYMDGGKLIINSADKVSFANEIMGTDHNNVNIEVAGSTTTLTGTIYGNKDLVKTGEGVLDLQMETNGYAGNTIISSGTVIGTTKNINGKVSGSGAEDSAVEFYDAEGEVTLNEIADMGSFSKTGEATMTVENAFKAITANIESGVLVMNNADVEGNVKENANFTVDGTMTVTNAELRGYGNITAGDLIIGAGATFAPGNSTATFKVTGNLIFEEDGNYDVEFGQFDMDSEGHYNDNTQVTETVTIDPNAKITLNNLEGKYYVAETIDLINAKSLADGFEYKDDEEHVIFNDNDARDLREGYETRISTRVYTEGNALKIELQRKQSEYSEATEFDRSHNEQEVANAIDAISTGNGGDITNPLDAMEQLYYYESTYDIEGLKAALNDIGGVIHSNATNLAFFNTKAEHVYDKVKERKADILPCKKAHSKVWAEYYYNNYSVDKDDNSPEHETSVNGFLVGYDMISANNLTLGVTAGYGTSELKQAKDKATMNDINLGFYGGYETDKWLIKGLLLGGYEQYAIDRTIAFMDRTANSEHNGYSAALDLEVGYKISLNKKDSQSKHKIYLKPFIGAIGSYMNNEGYEEKNAESLNLKIEDYNAMTAEARAGLELNGKVKKFGWYAKAGARQLLTDKQNEIETSLLDFKDETKMKIWSAENAQTTITGGIGVDYDLSENWNIFANGLGNFADVATNYYANVGLMYKFGCINNKKVTDEDVEKITAMLNDKITEEEALKEEMKNKEKELNDAKEREKELQNRIQKYEANVVSEQEAEKMKNKKIKTFKLGEKPTFVFGTDKLNNNGVESLKQVATELENYPDAEVLVEGHTDNVGGDEVNQVISEKRAASVATSLKKDYGVRNNIAVIGKGKSEPIASNDTAEGRAKNRRVEITITTAD